jgi:bacteriocin biosynthesis cyclodehydratase domain-containing protein
MFDNVQIPASATAKLRALSVQLIEIPGGVILKRGCREMRITGKEVAAALGHILTVTADRGATVDEICHAFSSPVGDAVRKLIERLVECRFLLVAEGSRADLETPESNLEIFYWHFGLTEQQAVAKLNRRQIAILGVNFVSRQLIAALQASGMENALVVDVPLLRNLRLFAEPDTLDLAQWPSSPPLHYEDWLEGTNEKDLRCIVVTSDFGNHEILDQWNSFCLQHNYHFLPVVLENFEGYVGPLVIPKETACYQCLRARQNSHLPDPELARAIEAQSFLSQPFIGFHPSMASILGDITAIELIKYYTGLHPLWNVGTLIEVNLLSPHVRTRKVLKIPRCKACSTLNTTVRSEIVKPVMERTNPIVQ